MTYPAFPVAGNVPWALWTEDPGHMLESQTVIIGDGTPGGSSGGALIVDPVGVGTFSPRKAMTSWTFVNIIPPGENGIFGPVCFPQRIGKIYNVICTNGAENGQPFST